MARLAVDRLRFTGDTPMSTQTFCVAVVAIVMGGLLTPGNAAAQIAVTGYGHYCSKTWPNGGWAFTSDAKGNDPCGYITAHSDPGGTIQRAGIYQAAGMNTVVARCTDNTVWLFGGTGQGPLTAAYDKAKGRPGCIFTVAPRNLPIFKSPFKNVVPTVANGFDFARPAYGPLNVSDFGQSGPAQAKIVNLRGDDRTWGDNHDAYDYLVPEGTPVYALAGGTVLANRNLDTKCSGSNSPIQGEMYIRHRVNRTPSTYNEDFVAGYFHLTKRAGLAVGQSVTAGTYLGDIGWVGCSDRSHMHFAVIRTTNVAGYRKAAFTVPSNETGANNGWHWVIDPYGFIPPKNIDPWGWRGYPDGALSINLWQSGQAPALGTWGP